MYRFIASQSGSFAVETQCRVLRISRSAYYQWLAQQKKMLAGENKKEVETLVISIFTEHRRRYGVRRIVAELNHRAVKASSYTVRNILRDHGLKAIQPRSFVPRTTDSRHP